MTTSKVVATLDGDDWLVFNDIHWGQVTLGVGSLKLTLPDGGEIHLDDFDPDHPMAPGGIEYFQFADGTVMTQGESIDALGIAPTGTPQADVLSGTALTETIQALSGDDVVTARAGDDTVFAGDGNDAVYAGQVLMRMDALITEADASALAAESARKRLALRRIAAEILLGTRSVAKYLVSPVQKAWHEAVRER